MLADRFEGKRLNSPNDIVCARDGSIWFTDPLFGILGHWEGEPADSETPWAVYRIDPRERRVAARDRRPRRAQRPGVLARREDPLRRREPRRAAPQDLGATTSAPTARSSTSACSSTRKGPGAYDGIAVDAAGNVWCGFGSSAPASTPTQLDGVRVYDPDGKAIGHIHLPERCANLCFGGAKNNRLFMAASHSLYALYVNTTGAV